MDIFIFYAIICGILTLLAVTIPLASPFFRGRKRLLAACTRKEQTDAVPVSIVIVEHDSAFRLEQILPRYLSQKYDADYQVIVVIDQNDSESEDVLKRHSDNPHLYYTTLPVTSRYLSRKKLGITLGIRAAKYDWVVVTDVHCTPTSDEWLTAFASHCTEDKNMVMGMTPFENDAPAYYRFEHLRTMLYYLRHALNGMAFSTNQSLVAIRKSKFFEQKGFSGNLEYTRAEQEFLVNKFAEEGKTDVAVEPEAWLQQFNPKPERWMGRQLFSLDAMKGLQRKGWYKFWSRTDSFLMHFFNIMMLILFVLFCWATYDASEKCPQDPTTILLCYIYLATFAVVWLFSQIVRFLIYRPVLKEFTISNPEFEDYSYINPLLAIIFEWTMSCRNIVLKIRYHFADKNDFITHKL